MHLFDAHRLMEMDRCVFVYAHGSLNRCSLTHWQMGNAFIHSCIYMKKLKIKNKIRNTTSYHAKNLCI